jgi:hypothetical protein
MKVSWAHWVVDYHASEELEHFICGQNLKIFLGIAMSLDLSSYEFQMLGILVEM